MPDRTSHRGWQGARGILWISILCLSMIYPPPVGFSLRQWEERAWNQLLNFFKHQPGPTFVRRASLCIYQTNKTFAINNIHIPNKNRAKKRTYKNIMLITSKHKSFLFIYFIFIYISLFYFFCLYFDARKIIALACSYVI